MFTNLWQTASRNCGTISENVPRYKIAKTLKIPPSTVKNIKRFRVWEASVLKGQGWGSKLDRVIFRPSGEIKNRHDCLLYITAWVQEYVQKSLSKNTVNCEIHKCKLKLYHRKEKNAMQKHQNLLWAKAHLKRSEAELFCGQMSCRLKRRRTIHFVISRQLKSLHLWWSGVALVSMMQAADTSRKAPPMLKITEVLEQHLLPSRQQNLFQKRLCTFQQDNAKLHPASITTAWLHRRRVQVLNWSDCSPDLWPEENIWHIIEQKICQRRNRTVEQLESCIRHERDNIPFIELQQLVSSIPRCLDSCYTKRGGYRMVNITLFQLFWDM